MSVLIIGYLVIALIRMNTYVYVCPHCKQIGTLHSKGNFLTCDCGYKVEFGQDGFFHECEKALVFDNVLDWDKWQKEQWIIGSITLCNRLKKFLLKTKKLKML